MIPFTKQVETVVAGSNSKAFSVANCYGFSVEYNINGAGTIKLQGSNSGSDFVDIPTYSAAYTSGVPGLMNYDKPCCFQFMRINITGTGTASLNIGLKG